MSGLLARLLAQALEDERKALEVAMAREIETQGQALLVKYPQLKVYYDNGYRFESIDPLVMYKD